MTFTNKLKGYQLLFKNSALKDLELLPKQDNVAILEKLEALTTGQNGLDVKKLQGYDQTYRMRHGNYRIIYQVKHREIIILVIAVGSRQSIYKRFSWS